jgi:MFS family permease
MKSPLMEISEPITAPAARPTFLGLPALASLRHRDFRILWLGMLLSSSTIMFQWFAIGRLIEDYFPQALGESFPILLMLGIAGLTRGLGLFVFSIAGGAMADRYDRRTIAIGTQTAGIALVSIFALLIALDWIAVWQVFILLFLVSATQTFDLPSRQAMIPQLVEPGEVTNAVSLFTASMQTGFAVAPLFAGYFVDTVGIAGTYAASIVGYGALLLALLFIHPRGRPVRETHTGVVADISEGVRHTRRDPVILGLLAVSFTVSAIGVAVLINLSPYWILRVLDVSPTTWGVLAAIWGIGAVLTSYSLSARGNFGSKGLLFLGASMTFSVLFVAWGLVRDPVVFAVVQFFMAVCISTQFVTGGAIIQNLVPDHLRGRILSLYGLNQAIALAMGIVVGAFAEAVGATTAVPILAAVLVGLIGYAALTLRDLRDVD